MIIKRLCLVSTTILMFGLTLNSSTLFAHDCILTGTGTQDITIYNQCVADITSSHKRSDTEDRLNREVELLQAENRRLQNRITKIKQILSSVLNQY